jgi:hypothetical protein
MTVEAPKMYCANHPNVETSLRCNKCEKPICARCAILTPTGYRCKECVRGQQKVFETAKWLDYPLIFMIVAILAYRRNRALHYPAPPVEEFIHPGGDRRRSRLYPARTSNHL